MTDNHHGIMSKPHRKLIHHVHEPGDIHELTFSCYQRQPLLTNDLWLSELAGAIDRSNQRHSFGLLAYVFMPEHVHLLVAPLTPEVNLPQLLSDIKQPTSREIKRRLQEINSPLVERLTVHQRPGITTFRFWQEGPGYDRNFNIPGKIQTAIDYIHENPVRRKLCRRATDWKWSSARRLLMEPPDLLSPPALYRFDVTNGWIEPPTKGSC